MVFLTRKPFSYLFLTESHLNDRALLPSALIQVTLVFLVPLWVQSINVNRK